VVLKGTDCLFNGEDRVIRLRRLGDRYEEAWVFRPSRIVSVRFDGGSFLDGSLSATIRGEGFIVRVVRDEKVSQRLVKRLRFDSHVFILHPSLLKHLIAIAEPMARSGKDRKMLRRAKRFLKKALEKTPGPVPIEEIGEEAAEEEILGEKGQFPKKAGETFGVAFVALIALGIGVFLHLRGSIFDFILVVLPFPLMGSFRWAWPVLSAIKSKELQTGIIRAVDVSLFFVAAFILFFPILWLLFAVYIIFVLYCVAGLRFGPYAARRIVRFGVLFLLAYLAILLVYFGNRQVRVERVFSLRYRSCLTFPSDFVVSPDGATIAFDLDAPVGGEPLKSARFRRPYDNPLTFFLRASAILLGGAIELPEDRTLAMLFVPTQGGEAKELLVPAQGAMWKRWSPDSRFLAFQATVVGKNRNQVWVAEPARSKANLLYDGEMWFLPAGRDPWSTGSRFLSLFSFKEDSSTSVCVVFDIETGVPQVRPYRRRPAPPEKKQLSRFEQNNPHVSVSPDLRWRAVAEWVDDSVRLIIERRKDNRRVATVNLPPGGEEDLPSLIWSPDNRRLAAAFGWRIWVYDVKTGRTVLVKAGRRRRTVTFEPDEFWSPDSRSFYYLRFIAGQIIGTEVMKVTLRD